MGFGMSLKEALFSKTESEMYIFYDMKSKGKPYYECEAQRQRFCSLMEFVEDSGLRKEYDKWKANKSPSRNNIGQKKPSTTRR